MEKITKIEIQKNNSERVNIYINEEYSFSCYSELVYKYSLVKNKEVEIDNLKSLIEDEEYIKGKSYILKVIEKGFKTQKQIEEKLRDKEYEEKTINKIVEFLKEYNFIDDDNYAKLFAKDKIKKQGKNKIKYTLKQKGVNESIINETLYEIDEDTELQSAIEQCSKKYKNLSQREMDKMKLKSKLYSYLSYRGYGYGIIMKAIDEVMNER